MQSVLAQPSPGATLTLYRGAKRPTPIRVDEIPDWPETVAAVTELAARSAPTKLELLAIGPHRLRPGGKRCNADVEAVSLLAIDVDRCNTTDLVTALATAGVAALIYGSPSDDPDGPEDARRVRVVAPVTRELAPAECAPARLAFAEVCGLGPGVGVEKCLAPAQLFFVGRLDGTAERNVAEIPGDRVDVDALLARPLVHDWRPAAPAAEPAPAAATGEVAAELAARLDRAADAAEPFYVPGERHALGCALAAFCRHKGVPQAGAEALLEELATRTGSDVAAALARARWTYSAAAVHPAGASALPPELLRALDAIELGDAWTLRALQGGRADAAPPRAPGLGPLILQARGDGGTVLLDEGPDGGGYQPVAVEVLPQRLAEIGQGGLTVDGKRRLSPRALIERHGATYRTTVTDFAAREARYEPAQSRVVLGFRVPDIAPAFDAAADAWLRALAGAKYDQVAEWIAGAHQRHIARPATALTLIGAHSIGKTLIATALARLWGDRLAPVPMRVVVKRFNLRISLCPIVLDDECVALTAGDVSTGDFRALVADRQRGYEPKGREAREVWGALRFVLTANDLSRLRFSDEVGAGAAGAIAERLLLVECGEQQAVLERLDAVRDASGDADLGRLCGHFRWLQETVAVPDGRQRFIGADPDREASIRAALAGIVDDAPEVFDRVRGALTGGRVDGGRVVRPGALWVRPADLAGAIDPGAAERGAKRGRAALSPFRVKGQDFVRDGAAHYRAWRLDVERLVAVLGLDAAAVAVALADGESQVKGEAPAIRAHFQGGTRGEA